MGLSKNVQLTLLIQLGRGQALSVLLYPAALLRHAILLEEFTDGVFSCATGGTITDYQLCQSTP